jgi:hypothetical protein
MAKSFPNTGATVIDATADLPGSPSEGMMVFQKDTNELKIYDGASWVSMLDTDGPPGLQLINPTSVTGGTNTNGKISFSASSGTSVDGVFSSTYDNYRVVLTPITIGVGQIVILRFRVGATEDAGTNYSSVRIYGNAGGAVAATGGVGLQHVIVGAVNASYAAPMVFDILGPNLAATTAVSSGVFFETSTTSGSAYVGAASGIHIPANQNTGFSLYGFGTTLTGSMRVYGYRNSI